MIKHPDEDGFLVIFGTGSYITREDADDEEIQSIYAIWDRGETSPAMAQPNSKYDRLVEQTLTNIVDEPRYVDLQEPREGELPLADVVSQFREPRDR